jgi:hypothetical protein
VIFTRQEKLACAERELRLRKRAYPRWLANGRITPGDAQRELALMEAIAEDYREPDLFGEPR